MSWMRDTKCILAVAYLLQIEYPAAGIMGCSRFLRRYVGVYGHMKGF